MYALQLYIYFCEPISSNRVDMYDSRTFFHLQYCKEQDRRTLVDLFYQDDQFLNSGNAFVQDSYSEKVTSGFDIGYVRCMPNYKDWNATGFRAQLKLKTGTSIVARWDCKSSVRRKLSPRKNKFVHAKQHLTYQRLRKISVKSERPVIIYRRGLKDFACVTIIIYRISP